VQLRGRGKVTSLSSLPPLPCPPEGAQVGFERLTATEAIGSLKLKRLIRAAALSLNRSIALAISGSSVGSVNRVAARDRAVKSTAVSQDGLIPSAARLEPSRPRRCLDEPLSPLVLSHFQLACKSQRYPCRRHYCLLGSLTRMTLLTNAPQRSGVSIISPPLFLSYLWLRTPVVTFFACSSKPLRLAHTVRPDDAVFFSLASSHSYNHNRPISAIRSHRGTSDR
jgi:hypothetical protein